MLHVVTLGSGILREKAEQVTLFDKELVDLVNDMFATLVQADGIGLAAPQVNIGKRLFVVDTRKARERLVFVNPQIIETSYEQGVYEEGCLSIPGMYADIIRSLEVTVQAQDLSGKSFVKRASGLLARVIQHEYDHLNGILFIDHMQQDAREQLLDVYDKRRKNAHGT